MFERSRAINLVHQSQSPGHVTTHRNRRCMIERHDWRWIDAHQLLIERHDLRPISFVSSLSFGMNRGYGGLDLIIAHSTQRKRMFNKANPFFDLFSVPNGAVLFLERHKLASM